MDKIKKALDELGVHYSIHKNKNLEKTWYALVEFWTDAEGQDIPTEFDFDGTAEDFVKEFVQRAESYDVDEEVDVYTPMRGTRGVPYHVMDIVRDCQEAKDTLMMIAEALKKVLKEDEVLIDGESKSLSDVYKGCMLIGHRFWQKYDDTENEWTASEECSTVARLTYEFMNTLNIGMEKALDTVMEIAINDGFRTVEDHMWDDYCKGFLAGEILGAPSRKNLEKAIEAEELWGADNGDAFGYYHEVLELVKKGDN